MKAIGEITPGLFERIKERRQARRADRIARFNLSDNVHCAECGDTGKVLEDGQPCRSCEYGRGLIEREYRNERWRAKTPVRFRDFSLSTHPDTTAATKARGYIDSRLPHGDNLLLTGPVGSGKTGLAYGIARDRYIAGGAVRIGNMVDILDGLRPADPSDTSSVDPVTVRHMTRIPLLILDDVGAEKPSDFTAERLYAIINGRYEARRPTIITTNMGLDALEKRYGARVMSRFMQDAATLRLASKNLREA